MIQGMTMKDTKNQVLAARNLIEIVVSLEYITATIVHKYCNTIINTKRFRQNHSGNIVGLRMYITAKMSTKSHIIGSSGMVVERLPSSISAYSIAKGMLAISNQ